MVEDVIFFADCFAVDVLTINLGSIWCSSDELGSFVEEMHSQFQFTHEAVTDAIPLKANLCKMSITWTGRQTTVNSTVTVSLCAFSSFQVSTRCNGKTHPAAAHRCIKRLTETLFIMQNNSITLRVRPGCGLRLQSNVQ